MTFRARFLVLFSLAVLAGIGLLALGAARVAHQQFEQVNAERRATLTAQFQRELAQRGEEVSFAMQGLADTEGTVRMALDLSRTQADASIYANDARGLAAAHQLDFLDLAAADGTLISSSQARSGYKDDWVTAGQDWNQRGAFLQRLDLPDGAELALLAVRVVSAGATKLYLIGGRRIDHEFLHTLAFPAGTRALLYRNLGAAFAPEDLAAAEGGVDQPERFAGIIESAEKSQAPSQQTIAWTSDPASTETFNALPLTGRQNEALGMVLIGSTQRDLFALLDSIRLAALIAALLGILGGIFLSSWLSARVTKPLERITASVREVTAGNWATRVDIRGHDEAGQLAEAFNEMTKRLPEERSRLVQAERVAAWRDVTQRMTQEMKQSLFPLEVTVGSLSRVPEEPSSRSGAVFQESVAVLRSELGRLKAVAMRFSELSKMPQPRLKPLDVNELLREVLKSFEPQFRPFGRPPITPELSLDGGVSKIPGDGDLLRKALENLLLHAIDGMPTGGALAVRTEQSGGTVRVEVSSSGAAAGATSGEGLFAAFRTRQSEAAGLGLPTTQAIVSDHGGKFFAEAVPGVGTVYRLEFAVASGAPTPAPVRAAAPKRKPKRDLPEVPQVAVQAHAAALESVPAVDVAPADTPAVAPVVVLSDALAPELKRGLPEIPRVVTVLGAFAAEPEFRIDVAPAIAALEAFAPEPKRDLQEVLEAAAALNVPSAETSAHVDVAPTIAAEDAPVVEPKRDLQEMLQAAAELAGPSAEPTTCTDIAPNVTVSDSPVSEAKRDLQEALQVTAALSAPTTETETSDRPDAGPTIAVLDVSKTEPKGDLQEIFQAVAALTASTAKPTSRVDVVPAIVTVDASALESKGDLQEFLQAAAAALTGPATESTPGIGNAPSFAALAEPKGDPQEILQAAAALHTPAAEAAPAPHFDVTPAPGADVMPAPSIDVTPALVDVDAFTADAKSDLPAATEAAPTCAETATEAIPGPFVDTTPALAALDAAAFEPKRGLQEILQAAAAPTAAAADPEPLVYVAPVLAAVDSSTAEAKSDPPETAELAAWFTGAVADTAQRVAVVPIIGASDATIAEAKSESAETDQVAAAPGLSVEVLLPVAPSDPSTTGSKRDSPEVVQAAAGERVAAEPGPKPEAELVVPAPLLKPAGERPILSYRG